MLLGQEDPYTTENESYSYGADTETAGENTGYGYQGKKKKSGSLLPVVIAIVAALALGVGIFFGIRAMTNSYKKPVSQLTNLLSNKDWDEKRVLNFISAGISGLGKKELHTLMKDLKESDEWEDLEEELFEYWVDGLNDTVDSLRDKYGEDFKVKIKIDDKEELESSELKKYRESIREVGEDLYDELEDPTSTEIETFADMLDIERSEAKQIIKDLRAWAKVLKKVKIDEGYRLYLEVIVTGEELDEPEELEIEITVYRINGYWTLGDTSYNVPSVLDLF